ncbi:aldehyde dehydrogenase family protein [Pseudonocardia bannensis]|uniref:aldehyde dehydrogenase family protein n=1 Tax=Pseudonocardia bannensis TaxID=630973 RepID=UPI001B7CEE11|nr:aldehyde dehydrogenase family protein [Pseudonocardia bannensis]
MTSIPEMDGGYTLLGESRGPVEGQTLEVISPVDGSVVGRVHEFTPEEIETALNAAAEQQPAWAEQPLDVRARLLAKTADVLEARADELAELLVMEVAKARKDSRDEVLRSADFIRFTAEEGKRIVGDAQFSDAFPRQPSRSSPAVVPGSGTCSSSTPGWTWSRSPGRPRPVRVSPGRPP